MKKLVSVFIVMAFLLAGCASNSDLASYAAASQTTSQYSENATTFSASGKASSVYDTDDNKDFTEINLPSGDTRSIKWLDEDNIILFNYSFTNPTIFKYCISTQKTTQIYNGSAAGVNEPVIIKGQNGNYSINVGESILLFENDKLLKTIQSKVQSRNTLSPDFKYYLYMPDWDITEGDEKEGYYIIDESSGEKYDLLTEASGELPVFSPDGQTMAYAGGGDIQSLDGIYIYNLNTKEKNRIPIKGSGAITITWSSTGDELWVIENGACYDDGICNIYKAVVSTKEITKVASFTSKDQIQFDTLKISNGKILYLKYVSKNQRSIVEKDAASKENLKDFSSLHSSSLLTVVSYSPDGSKIMIIDGETKKAYITCK